MKSTDDNDGNEGVLDGTKVSAEDHIVITIIDKDTGNSKELVNKRGHDAR